MTTVDHKNLLNPEECDALNELIHISIGKAINSVNSMVGSRIKWNIPQVNFSSNSPTNNSSTNNSNTINQNYYTFGLDFAGDFIGKGFVAFDMNGSKHVSAKLNEMALEELDQEIETETLKELTNILVTGIIGSLSNLTNTRATFKTPELIPDNTTAETTANSNEVDVDSIFVTTCFTIPELELMGSLQISFKQSSISKLCTQIRTMLSQQTETHSELTKRGA